MLSSSQMKTPDVNLNVIVEPSDNNKFNIHVTSQLDDEDTVFIQPDNKSRS
jgi:hypothetical protein